MQLSKVSAGRVLQNSEARADGRTKGLLPPVSFNSLRWKVRWLSWLPLRIVGAPLRAGVELKASRGNKRLYSLIIALQITPRLSNLEEFRFVGGMCVGINLHQLG